MVMRKVDEVMLRYPCDYCGVDVGVWCQVPTSGRRATDLHANRFVQATKARALPLREW